MNSSNLDNRIHKIFDKPYFAQLATSNRVFWREYINGLDLGIECVRVVIDDGYICGYSYKYKIVDAKKFIVTCLKYGM